MIVDHWHARSPAATLAAFQSSLAGLSSPEAEARLRREGQNIWKRLKVDSWWKILLRQLYSPLMGILFLALVVGAVLSDVGDLVFIALAILVHVTVGFLQEYRAHHAWRALQGFLVPSAHVRRDGESRVIPSHDLVPGDVILLAVGDQVPADARLLVAHTLEVNASALTGESSSSAKSIETVPEATSLSGRSSLVHAGTLVVAGRAEAVVVATGFATELGRIAKEVQTIVPEETPLQQQLGRLSRFLVLLFSVAAVTIFFVGLFVGKTWVEMLLLAIALAVAAVPEGLLVAVTVVLARGMQRMLKRQALVRRLLATETLGSVSVICTDKTGTITEGNMKIVRTVTAQPEAGGLTSSRLLELSVLCNNGAMVASGFQGTPTDTAFLVAAQEAGLSVLDIRKRSPRRAELPFDSSRKFMATVHEGDGACFVCVKGAAERVVQMADLVPERRAWWQAQIEAMGREGLRVLAVASRAWNDRDSLEAGKVQNLTLVGLVGMRDPLRSSAVQTIATAKAAGVRTVLVTGDHPETAVAVAREAGIGGNQPFMATGEEIEQWSEDEWKAKVASIDVFARVDPLHKVKIVRAWQAQQAIVAMTGDGVNDAPALAAANIGVALGSGTDVAKEAADIVLLDNRLETIVAAIEEGRVIFENIRKVLGFLLLTGGVEMGLVLLSLVFNLPLPITAAQILFINMVTDGLPAIALTAEDGETHLMHRPPRALSVPILDASLRRLLFMVGPLLTLLPFGLFVFVLPDAARAQSIVFALVSVQAAVSALSWRSLTTPLWRVRFKENRAVFVAVCASLLLTAAAFSVPDLAHLLRLSPLALKDIGLFSMIGVIGIVAIEFGKRVSLPYARTRT